MRYFSLVNFCFLVSFFCGNAGANSSTCDVSRNHLVQLLEGFCESFESYGSRDIYLEEKQKAKSIGVDYFECGRQGLNEDDSEYVEVFSKSTYALAEIDFYLKVMEERRKEGDLEYWRVEKEVLAESVKKECRAFFELFNNQIKGSE